MAFTSPRTMHADPGLWRKWPGLAIREPSRRQSHYLHQKRLVLSLQAAVGRNLHVAHGHRILDVGSGRKPYYPLFAPYAREYIGLDAGRGVDADVRGESERLPFRDRSIDVIVSTQVLEHVSDPVATVAEWTRVLAPGGIIFASTHGMYLYHPIPDDHWRWTHTGLRKLVESSGLHIRSIEACERTLSVLTMLVAIHASTFAERRRLGWLSGLVLAGLHRIVDRIDAVTSGPAIPDSSLGWGSMPCSYLVVADRPSEETSSPDSAGAITSLTPAYT